MHIEKINNLDKEFQKDSSSVSSLKELEEIRIKYFSRSGLLSQLFDELKNVSKEDKPVLGKSLNELRNKLSAQFDKIKEELESNEIKTAHKIDLTLPGVPKQIGSKHILTQSLDQIKKIFNGFGFSVFEGPEIESDYNNFEALNFPEDHPARDMQD
ncbi:MAG: phenylalanine--tRNA ligase subunit alpha, partial [Ignavibacteria bacterium]